MPRVLTAWERDYQLSLLPEEVRILYRGDLPGHEFHGNQWTGGEGSGTLAPGYPRDDGDAKQYGISHRPTPGPPVNNLLGDSLTGDGPMLDESSQVYEHPEWYCIATEQSSKETIAALREYRGVSDTSLVRIYRSVPTESTQLHNGDWISLSRNYAHESNLDPADAAKDLPVESARVPAAYVRWAGDDLNEFGYFGPTAKWESIRGDVPGHSFHGNQWTGGIGGGDDHHDDNAEMTVGVHQNLSASTATAAKMNNAWAKANMPEVEGWKRVPFKQMYDVYKTIVPPGDANHATRAEFEETSQRDVLYVLDQKAHASNGDMQVVVLFHDAVVPHSGTFQNTPMIAGSASAVHPNEVAASEAKMLSTVRDLAGRGDEIAMDPDNDVHSMVIHVENGEQPGTLLQEMTKGEGAEGVTRLGGGLMALNGSALLPNPDLTLTEATHGEPWLSGKPDDNAIEWTLTHEWGHAVDRGAFNDATSTIGLGGLSSALAHADNPLTSDSALMGRLPLNQARSLGFGSYALSGDRGGIGAGHELVAEAYARHVVDGTDDPITTQIVNARGWK